VIQGSVGCPGFLPSPWTGLWGHLSPTVHLESLEIILHFAASQGWARAVIYSPPQILPDSGRTARIPPGVQAESYQVQAESYQV
jgi:hypothetical protein